MKRTDLLRYALWLGVVYTGNANRKFFGLPTTWVFHLTLNSFVLFLPEIIEIADTLLPFDAQQPGAQPDLFTTVRATLRDVVVTQDKYAYYVAPVALAYIVSHPQFNIYKGDLAKLRLFGFGLDAIPHSATAFTFTRLMMDMFDTFLQNTPRDASWRALAESADQHSGKMAGAFLAAASTLYESGEYAIHEEELRETGGDESKINLVWSAQDTLFDLLSNAMGWVLALALSKKNRASSRTRWTKSSLETKMLP